MQIGEITELEEQEDFTININDIVKQDTQNTTTETTEQQDILTNEIVKPIVLESLEELGLTEIELFKEDLTFEEGLDLDTKEGIAEVIRRSIGIGAKMFIEDSLKSHPELYQAYLHVEAGNPFSSFINTENSSVSLDALKNNITLQSSIFKEDLLKKGIDEDIVDTIIKKAIDTETLFDKSKNVVEKRNQELSESIKKQEEAVVKEKELHSKMVETVANITGGILTGNDLFDGLLSLQENKKQGLYDSFLANTSVEKGVAYYKIPLTDENIKQVIESHVINADTKVRDKIYTAKLKQEEIKRRVGDTKKPVSPVIDKSKKEEKISVDSIFR